MLLWLPPGYEGDEDDDDSGEYRLRRTIGVICSHRGIHSGARLAIIEALM